MGDLRALDLFRRLTVEQGRMVLAAAAQPNAFVAPIIDLSMKTAGMPLIYHLIDAAFAAGAGRPAGTIEVSVAAAARRFGVSRAHIARLITRMEGLGYIERSSAPNTLILTEAFAEAYETYYAFGHIALARACNGALDSRD
ncbi:MAG: MarR family transcriptional regulator [Pseudomonadota bacterium]|nr:MarR family transcriptional regulator [Pseudomonadota bacterium]